MSRRRRNEQIQDWDFFTFPVIFAFALGGFFVAFFSAFIPIGLLFMVFLFLSSFGVAHMISRWIRRRTLDRQKQRSEEEERERRALAARAAAQRNEESARQPRRRRRVRRAGRDTP